MGGHFERNHFFASCQVVIIHFTYCQQRTPKPSGANDKCYEEFAREYFQPPSTFSRYTQSQNIFLIESPAPLTRPKRYGYVETAYIVKQDINNSMKYCCIPVAHLHQMGRRRRLIPTPLRASVCHGGLGYFDVGTWD